jgi:hypothetical protein
MTLYIIFLLRYIKFSSIAGGKHGEIMFGKLVASRWYTDFSSYCNIIINDNEILFKQEIFFRTADISKYFK